MTAIFNFNGTDLRTIEIEGAPWFVAADVCAILGLDTNKGTYMHLAKLSPDEKLLAKRAVYPKLFLGKSGALLKLVSRPGLFALISRSSKPEAQQFQRWVNHEVLPAICDTGGYLLNEEARETAHAATRTEVPLPEWVKQAFDELRREVCHVRSELFDHRKLLAENQDLLAKLASGENPEPVWHSNNGPVLIKDMDDAHIRRALASCRKWKWTARPVYDSLLTEQQRRKTTAAEIAKREVENAKRREEAAAVLAEAQKKAEAILAKLT